MNADGEYLPRETIYMRSAFGDGRTKAEKDFQDSRHDIIIKSKESYFGKMGMADFDMLKRTQEDNDRILKRFKAVTKDINEVVDNARDLAAKELSNDTNA